MTSKYEFHPHLILRTPRNCFSIQTFNKLVISNNAFMEALYLASPILTEQVTKPGSGWGNDKKIMFSVYKYWLRASTRCTPFGLFSACSIAAWNNRETGMALTADVIKRHSRFDMHYVCALAQQLSVLPFIKSNLTFYPNNSLYQINNELRYVEYSYENGRRKHQISSVQYTEYLKKILQNAANGTTLSAITNLLITDSIRQQEAAQYIDELVQAQVLVSELEPAITGKEFIYQVISCLKKIYAKDKIAEIENIIRILDTANRMLTHIDQQTVNAPDKYIAIENVLKNLEVPFEKNKLFQTDIIKTPVTAFVNSGIQKDIADALEVLNRLTPNAANSNLATFAKRFEARYETKEISLLEVLDTETGLGYIENTGENTTPLLDDIFLAPPKEKETNLTWGPVENLLNEKLNTAYKNGSFSIEITDEDIKPLKEVNWDNLPPSMSVMFRLLSGPQNIFIQTVSGSSAANLLGRFAHADEGINTMVNDITAKEAAVNPDIIFAEIIHLPESRMGNILLHPQFRTYEIPYLAASAVENEYKINVSDLFISVKNKQIILRNKKLNKIIIPRLSTAHNYSTSNLPVYHFLCDLQQQGHRNGLYFSWGSLAARFHFLPRLYYKKVILSPATWRFSKKHYKHMLTENDVPLLAKMASFKMQWQLPKLIVLADGDNELLINLDDLFSVEMLVDAIKNKQGIELKEFLLPDENAVKDNNDNVYCNQFIAPIIKKTATYHTPKILNLVTDNIVQRSFSPGSSWVYYKLYCGEKSADKILAEAIWPLINDLQQKGLINKFFFIRYNDSSHHIRLRLLLSNTTHIGKVMQWVQKYLMPFEQSIIWKTQMDTYERELERYGANNIETSETLFYYDSVAVLQMLTLTGGDGREQLRWLWTLRAIDDLLQSFNYTLDKKIELTLYLKTSFLQEFNADKHLKTQLNNTYRKNRLLIERTLDKQNDTNSDIKPLLNILQQKFENMQPLAVHVMAMQQMTSQAIPLPQLLSSYIHMLVNRAILAKPRLHELVMYDMLYQYYFSVKVRNSKQVLENLG